MNSTKPPGSPRTIPVSLLKRLERNDPAAWHVFFQWVFEAAQSTIERALAGGSREVAEEARRLVQVYRREPIALRTALELAWSSFRGRFIDGAWSPAQVGSEEDCAACLIRVAYNRWQRENYHGRRLSRQSALGELRALNGEAPTLLAQQPDRGAAPEEDVELADFLDVLEQVLVEFVEPFPLEDRLIIYLHHYERMTPREISRSVGAPLARCQDLPRLWRLHLIQRFPRTLDFLRPELPEPPQQDLGDGAKNS